MQKFETKRHFAGGRHWDGDRKSETQKRKAKHQAVSLAKKRVKLASAWWRRAPGHCMVQGRVRANTDRSLAKGRQEPTWRAGSRSRSSRTVSRTVRMRTQKSYDGN